MEWSFIKELNDLLRFWKTDRTFKDELINDPDVTYATRTVDIINKISRLIELLDALHEVIYFTRFLMLLMKTEFRLFSYIYIR
jgi:hypothetical protein